MQRDLGKCADISLLDLDADVPPPQHPRQVDPGATVPAGQTLLATLWPPSPLR